MSKLNFAQLQANIESALEAESVVVFYKKMNSDGEYCDNGSIFINSDYQGNDEETLRITTHEVVHHLQQTRGMWIGEEAPIYWDSRFNQEQSDYLLELVHQYYEYPETWKYEIPAWSLQYDPVRVYEALIN
jgi:hypothetical protein